MAYERRKTPQPSANGANLPDAVDESTLTDAPFDRPPVEPPALVLAAPLLWEKYKALILGAFALVLLGLVGSAIYGNVQARKLTDASAALSAAKSPEEFQKVIADYPDTPAGADAWLLLARAQREKGDAKTAEATLRTFVDKHPKNPLAGGALLALAGELQTRGDRDGALGLFQQAADRYPKGFSAPMALFGKAELQRLMGKTDDARRTYENLIAAHPNSVSAQQAQGAMRFLRSPATATATPTVTGAAAMPTATGATAGASPSPTPVVAASPAPSPAASVENTSVPGVPAAASPAEGSTP